MHLFHIILPSSHERRDVHSFYSPFRMLMNDLTNCLDLSDNWLFAVELSGMELTSNDSIDRNIDAGRV